MEDAYTMEEPPMRNTLSAVPRLDCNNDDDDSDEKLDERVS